jgi:mannitol-1-phosphate/altronate dehydrogenase
MQLSREQVNGGKKYTERVIQFGEGNFLRAFVDWQLDIINEKTDLDAGIGVVRPIDTQFPPPLNTQDGVYTTIIRGVNGRNITKEYRTITSVNREISVYREFGKYLNLAKDPNFRFVISNTTEAGIVFDPADRFDAEPRKTTTTFWNCTTPNGLPTTAAGPARPTWLTPCWAMTGCGSRICARLAACWSWWYSISTRLIPKGCPPPLPRCCNGERIHQN